MLMNLEKPVGRLFKSSRSETKGDWIGFGKGIKEGDMSEQ